MIVYAGSNRALHGKSQEGVVSNDFPVMFVLNGEPFYPVNFQKHTSYVLQINIRSRNRINFCWGIFGKCMVICQALYSVPYMSSLYTVECWKRNILVTTQALVLCLIYTHSPSGAVWPQTLCIYIRPKHSCLCYISYMLHICIYDEC